MCLLSALVKYFKGLFWIFSAPQMGSLFARSVHNPIMICIWWQVVLIARIYCDRSFHELSVMQMQYFTSQNKDLVYVLYLGQRLWKMPDLFFSWQQLLDSVAQLRQSNSIVQTHTRGIITKWCALCTFHSKNYPCGHWPCSLHISAQIKHRI